MNKYKQLLTVAFVCGFSLTVGMKPTNAQVGAPSTWTLSEVRARAETGQPDGQYQLGERYLEGRGLPRDRTLAMVWFNLAAASGSEKASEERDNLEKALTPTQVAEAESIVRNWKTKEFLETPDLREFFRDQLRSLAIEAKLGFRVRRERKNDLMSRASGSEYWDTDFRFPGSTSQACRVVVPKGGDDDDALLFCTVFQAPDQDTLSAFFAGRCRTLMGILPADWLYEGAECDSRPPIMKNSIWIETSPIGGYGVIFEMLYTPGRGDTINVSLRSTDHCKIRAPDCDGQPIWRILGGNSNAASPSSGVAKPVERTIGEEIDNVVATGQFTALPVVRTTGSASSGQPSLRIENRTAYSLTVMLDGPVGRSLTVEAGATETVTVPAGGYRILGRVNAPNILPFFGNQRYVGGSSYSESFYIK